jgi:hypothetical protein
MSYTKYLALIEKKPELTREQLAKKLKVGEIQIIGWKHRRKAEGDCREMRYLNREMSTFPRFKRTSSGKLAKGQVKKGKAKR